MTTGNGNVHPMTSLPNNDRVVIVLGKKMSGLGEVKVVNAARYVRSPTGGKWIATVTQQVLAFTSENCWMEFPEF